MMTTMSMKTKMMMMTTTTEETKQQKQQGPNSIKCTFTLSFDDFFMPTVISNTFKEATQENIEHKPIN